MVQSDFTYDKLRGRIVEKFGCKLSESTKSEKDHVIILIL